MSNPFEHDELEYRVLVNAEGQHSLWPHFGEVPAGWTLSFGPALRQACLKYVEDNWTDMRPKSLIAAMSTASSEA